ncbi:MAG: N-6 DNA methylase [Opitutaceae bacterium]|nr:N-6 DNA methylase [Cytophagales bacterium]
MAVKDEIMPAYQIRRYAWSAKLPISILTDFEEFAIYDCNKKPNATDKPSVGRIKYLTFREYLKEFDFLWDTFSKGSVLKGSFDKFIAADKNKKGTTTVDKEFLTSLDEWRKQLALNIALRNEAHTEKELNFVVQQTLDRLIFLRIAEDRGVEEYGRLKTFFTPPKGESPEGACYQNLFTYFKEADSKYNSGLFDFKKDSISHKTLVDNKTIKGIINELYYPISPYEFSVLSVEILGSAYEQFLGKQIKLTPGHRAIIEEKPEVRKAGGVYYTPQYIVEYIVENTVGKLAPLLPSPKGEKQTTPAEVSKLKIVDPACGSGSFLLGAYQYLLNWHVEFFMPEFEKLTAIAQNSKDYTEKERNEAIKERNKLPLTPTGHLTTALKKQILLNNIYGVDIDTQAVEVTKLSLLLKCMEGETGSSINAEMRFGERVLPTLDSNIKSGNSLIDMDFYDGQIDFEPALEKKVKPFSWQQGFAAVFKQGGFDAVIGNPPYVGRSTSFEEYEKLYVKQKYKTSEGKYDLYQLFIEKALELTKEKNAYISFITPQTWLSIIQATKLRQLLVENVKFEEILLLGKNVFAASVDTIIFIIQTGSISKNINLLTVSSKHTEVKFEIERSIEVTEIQKPCYIFPISQDKKSNSFIKKIEDNCEPMHKMGIWYDGIKIVGKAKVFALQKIKVDSSFYKMYVGADIQRYCLKWSGFYCCRDKVNIAKHHATDIRLRSEEAFKSEKLLVRKTGNQIVASIDTDKFYYEQSLFGFTPIKGDFNNKVFMAILNSRIATYLLQANAFSKKDTFPQIRLHWLKDFPIKQIDFAKKSEKSLHDEIVQLVETMLQLQQQKQSSHLPNELQQLEQHIVYTDAAINKKVYALYGLSEEEVKVVEGEGVRAV